MMEAGDESLTANHRGVHHLGGVGRPGYHRNVCGNPVHQRPRLLGRYRSLHHLGGWQLVQRHLTATWQVATHPEAQ